MKNQQRGFTLIELIMVIAILGILAAFAIPKFADLSTQARVASVHGATASVKSASAIAHSSSLAGMSPVKMEGITVTLVNGYPAHTSIGAIAQVDTDFDVALDGTAKTATISAKDSSGTAIANCKVVYTEAASSTTAPTVTETTTGC